MTLNERNIAILSELELRNSMTDTQWLELCSERLHKVLDANIDVFLRLKDQ